MKSGEHSKSTLSAALALLFMTSVLSPAHAGVDVAQRPLILGDSDVPGNLFLVPSIEWPTMNSVANIGPYSPDTVYIGYFNPARCYVYQYDDEPDERHWAPSDAATGPECFGDHEWSGNFLNWAATQTIDPFRLALMGGYRFRDTESETWLQKARHDGQGNQYPDRTISDSSIVAGATPFDDADGITINIDGLSAESLRSSMRFTLSDSPAISEGTREYDPSEVMDASPVLDGIQWAEADVRVSVCVGDDLMRADLCHGYPTGHYKPEGLIQRFSRPENPDGMLRFSLFSYLNDHANQRDGGVMRSPKKFVGPEKLDTETGQVVENDRGEWDPETGILERNPDADLAAETSAEYGVTIDRSGIINYIGAAGQTNTNDYKSTDPLSELYYAATRYLRNLGPVSAYNAIPGNTGVDVEQALDDFPVVHRGEDWDDPLGEYFCAPNASLTIADVFTHRDKNLPGNQNLARDDEPTYWSELADDEEETGLNAVELTNRIGIIDEHINDDSLGESVFTGRENSAHIAGLAYGMHTRDQRPDLPGRQTMSTYAIDVVENQELEPPERNMLYLAAKYGGFNVPGGFDPDSREDSLPESWWNTTGDTASVPGTSTSFSRPDNYFLANEARRMVRGLETAFQQIAQEARGSAAAVAANSTDADDDTLLYQARFDTSNWSGEILAIELDAITPGEPIENVASVWRASERFPNDFNNRRVYTIDPDSGAGIDATDMGNLTADQQNALNGDDELLAYLLGDTENELRNGGTFRDRPETIMGHIVNSSPFVTRGETMGYHILPENENNAYQEFTIDIADAEPMLYVGANDGMLHGFRAGQDATDANVSFSFMPDSVFENIAELASPDYGGQFFVDGQVTVGHAYRDGWGADNGWGKVLAASTGAGARSVFALDVTDMHDDTFGADNVLREVSGDEHPDIGHVLGDIRVVRMSDANGGWAAVFGNGYNSDNHQARLIIMPLDGSDIISVPTNNDGSAANPNGLGAISTVSLNQDGFIDTVYAGDLHGNLWKFNLMDNSRSATQLFRTDDGSGNSQPITAAPRVVGHSDPGVVANVLVGTGQFFAEGDEIVAEGETSQTFYGIQDDGTGTTRYRGDLEQQSFDVLTESTRQVADGDAPDDGQHGWYIDLPDAGERVVDRADVVQEDATDILGDRVFFLSIVPEGRVCALGGRSWLTELNAETGLSTPTELSTTDPYADSVGISELATGLTRVRDAGRVLFNVSLASGALEQFDVEGGGAHGEGRQSWQELR